MEERESDEGRASVSSAPTGAPARGLLLPWPALSVGLAIVAGAALATLVTVVTMNGIDLLSTVALALAILAFVAQLVGSWSQAQSSAQMSADTYRINAETKSLLSQIRAQSESLIANQKDHFTDMLRALIDRGAIRDAVRASTTPESDDDADAGDVSTDVDNEALARSLEANLLETFRSSGSSGDAPEPVNPHAEFIQTMESYPDEEEGVPALRVLNGLAPLELAMLAKRAAQDLDRARRGLTPRAFTYEGTELTPASNRLRELGLIAFEDGERDGRRLRWRTLTPLGRQVARFITARGAMPQWLRDQQR